MESRKIRCVMREMILKREPPKGLVSDLRKTQTFIRKLKTIGDLPASQLIDDANKLNVAKFIDEIANAMAESKLVKGIDIMTAAQLCCIFHTRYNDFMINYLPVLLKSLEEGKNNEEEDKGIVVKKRGSIRLITELYLCGVLTDMNAIMPVIKQLMKNDKGDDPAFTNLSLLVSFCKYSPEDFFPNAENAASSLVEESVQKTIFALFEQYFTFLVARLEKRYTKVRAMEKENFVAKLTKGVVPDGKLTAFTAAKESYNILLTNITTLSDLLVKQVPDLPFTEFNANQVLSEIGLNSNLVVTSLGHAHSDGNALANSPWDDVETQAFYESLPDLKTTLPTMFYDATASVVEQTPVTEVVPVDENLEPEAAEETYHSSPLDTLLQKLPDMYTVATVDSIAEQFCYLNTKNARRRLIHDCYYLPRSLQPLIPYYARLIAILSKLYPDIGLEIVKLLRSEFFRLLRKNEQMNVESRLRNIRYLSELAKFKVCPTLYIFDSLRGCLDDFTGLNIDIVAACLECCGRFLYWNSETRLMTALAMDRIVAYKKSKYLDSYQLTLLENCLMTCNPPERSAVVAVVDNRTPLQKYVEKLLLDLTGNNVEDCLKKLRKLSWDSDCKKYMIGLFADVGSMKYQNLHFIASIVAGLQKFHSISVPIADSVLELIQVGLELNDRTQTRIAALKYLGELYNYRLINSHVIFDTLYRILTYGHQLTQMTVADAEKQNLISTVVENSEVDLNKTAPSIANSRLVGSLDKSAVITVLESPLDPPGDTFRIRLLTTLLQTCGEFFDQGTTKQKLNRFLHYFQRYILLKPMIPVDLQFAVWDMMDYIGTSVPRFYNLKAVHEVILQFEAADRARAVSANWKSSQSTVSSVLAPTSAPINMEDGDDLEDEENDDEFEEDHNLVEASTGLIESSTSSEEESDEDEQDDDEEDLNDEKLEDESEIVDVIEVERKPIEKTAEDIDFEREMELQMSQAVEQRRLDIGNSRSNAQITDVVALASLATTGNELSETTTSMPFRLITRKNNRPQARSILVPCWSELAASKSKYEQKATREKMELKRLVLAGLERNTAEEIAEDHRLAVLSSSEWALKAPEKTAALTATSSTPILPGKGAATSPPAAIPKAGAVVSASSLSRKDKEAAERVHWTSGLDRAVGDMAGAIPHYQQYRPTPTPNRMSSNPKTRASKR